jgi:hypothetical protein
MFSLILVVFVGLLFALAMYAIAWETYYQLVVGPVLERKLGFREGKAILPGGTIFGYTASVAIVSVVPGGVFERAGFRGGEALPDLSHGGLFWRLQRHRGRVVELSVVDGGHGPPFHERPRRVVRFEVPPRSRNAHNSC